MPRALDALTARTFDVVVVGGGIYGLTIACDAAQRGLTVALVERGDFGAASSFNHLRTIHGGLRYLQTLDLRRARESIRERRALARIAPWALSPLPFVLPIGGSLMRGRLAMRAGLLLDRLVSRDRNDGLPPSEHLPHGYVVGRREAVQSFPVLRGVEMTGAAVWHDYIATEADRLTLAWGLAARSHGAVLMNYVEATAVLSDREGVTVQATDGQTGRSVEIAGRLMVNATGAAIDRLLETPGLQTRIPMLRAMNLVTSIEAPPQAVGGRAGSGRNFFLVPWRGRALFGTWESPLAVAPGDVAVRPAEIAGFIRDLNLAFPSLPLSEHDVTLVHRGVVPAISGPGGQVTLDGREQIHDHAGSGAPALISVAGTKYTTARAVAEKVTDLMLQKLQRAAVPCRTATTPLPAVSLDADALLSHAATHEWVVHLEDAVVRRTTLGALGCPDEATVGHAACIVGGALGWSDERRTAEIERLRRFYDDDRGSAGASRASGLG